jgi:hypothetical protein
MKDGDPIALLDARALQPAGERDRVIAQPAIGQRPAEEQVGGAIRKTRRRDLEVEPERSLGSDHGTRQAPRPDREVRGDRRDLEFG